MAIFGTSTAGTWISSVLNRDFQFFVDEDPQRVGKTLYGKPVVEPGDLPVGTALYLALPSPMDERVASRLGKRLPELSIVRPGQPAVGVAEQPAA